MSLKEEIEKLIHAERQKLEQRDRQHKDFYQRQKDNFHSLRSLLEEIVESVDAAHLKSQIRDDRAIIEVGRQNHGHFLVDVRWEIEPNFEAKLNARKGESLFEDSSGFLVEEKRYYRFPEHDISEKIIRLESEQDVGEHLIKAMAEKVAHYEHLDALAKRQKKHDES